MIGEKLLSQKPIPLAEVEKLLSERKKEKELTYEQDITLKYAKRFAKLTEKQQEKLASELKKIKALDDEIIVKIIDILPESREVLSLMLPKDLKIDESDIAAILELTKPYAKKK